MSECVSEYPMCKCGHNRGAHNTTVPLTCYGDKVPGSLAGQGWSMGCTCSKFEEVEKVDNIKVAPEHPTNPCAEEDINMFSGLANKVSKPDCECGHSRDKHTIDGSKEAASGCLADNNIPDSGYAYCKCMKYKPKLYVDTTLTTFKLPDGLVDNLSIVPEPVHYKHVIYDDLVSAGNMTATEEDDLAKIAEDWQVFKPWPSPMVPFDPEKYKITFNVGTGKTWTGLSTIPKFPDELPFISKPAVGAANEYLKWYTGSSEHVIAGHHVGKLMAVYAKHHARELEEKIDVMVAEKLSAELKKEHKKACIPSFKKNHRKFR